MDTIADVLVTEERKRRSQYDQADKYLSRLKLRSRLLSLECIGRLTTRLGRLRRGSFPLSDHMPSLSSPLDLTSGIAIILLAEINHEPGHSLES